MYSRWRGREGLAYPVDWVDTKFKYRFRWIAVVVTNVSQNVGIRSYFIRIKHIQFPKHQRWVFKKMRNILYGSDLKYYAVAFNK